MLQLLQNTSKGPISEWFQIIIKMLPKAQLKQLIRSERENYMKWEPEYSKIDSNRDKQKKL